MGGTVEILELSVPKRPEEGGKSREAEGQCDGDEEEEGVHAEGSFNRLRRMALAMTSSDELDMASAAISGVT